jgi:hypothetical protein
VRYQKVAVEGNSLKKYCGKYSQLAVNHHLRNLGATFVVKIATSHKYPRQDVVTSITPTRSIPSTIVDQVFMLFLSMSFVGHVIWKRTIKYHLTVSARWIE